MPDWDCHAVPGERSKGNFVLSPSGNLEKIGWTVDGNLQINFKWGTGDADWVRSATEDVLSGKPDVLLGDAAAKAAQRATRTVPIIFIGSGRRSHSKPRPSAT